ncbi:MAG TPA: stage II sporulation protein M [Candidatus Woesearchaeota archaeon]|nr:stage II sporulation protein M [Candidatus Woesearchaeota archaeon]
MVLETNFKVDFLEKRFYLLLVFGLVYALVSSFFALWVFPPNPMLVSISLIILTTVPVFYKISEHEEQIGINEDNEKGVLVKHAKAINSFVFLFIGYFLGFFLMALILSGSAADSFFSDQRHVLSSINPTLTGNFFSNALSRFGSIFSNNLKVLIFCLVFSLVFGVGALFILVWNASVLGFAMAAIFQTRLFSFSASSEVSNLFNYLRAFFFSFFRFSLHGIPEIAAYFVAGLAGSIISFSIIKNHILTKKFENILLDVSNLIVISIVILVFAALLEVFVTPVFFRM